MSIIYKFAEQTLKEYNCENQFQSLSQILAERHVGAQVFVCSVLIRKFLSELEKAFSRAKLSDQNMRKIEKASNHLMWAVREIHAELERRKGVQENWKRMSGIDLAHYFNCDPKDVDLGTFHLMQCKHTAAAQLICYLLISSIGESLEKSQDGREGVPDRAYINILTAQKFLGEVMLNLKSFAVEGGTASP